MRRYSPGGLAPRWTWAALLPVLLLASGAVAQEQPDESVDEPNSSLRREGFSPKFSLHGFGDVTLTGRDEDPTPAP